MIGCLRTRVRKQPIIALYFESEIVLKFYNLEARYRDAGEITRMSKIGVLIGKFSDYVPLLSDLKQSFRLTYVAQLATNGNR